MNQLDDLHKIKTYLSRFSEQVRILNSNDDFSINILAEDLLIVLLNRVFNLQLINMNGVQRDYPAIDLLDESARIAVQITATPAAGKISECIEKFYRHGLYKKADRLVFFILNPTVSPRQATIDARITAIHQQAYMAAPQLRIDTKKDLWNTDTLYSAIKGLNDINKINDIAHYLKQQFDEITRQQNLSPYYDRLKGMFNEVVLGDESGMTLDQVYVAPSFSLHVNALSSKGAHLSTPFRRVDHRYKLPEFIDDFLARSNPLNCRVIPNMLLLLGYPGQGKSSLIKKFLNEYIVSNRHEKKPCFYFALRDIINSKNFIADPLKVLFEDKKMQTQIDLDYFSFGRSLIVLDGLDELYMKDNMKMEEVDRLVSDLIRLTLILPDLRIILTSRYGYVDTEKLAKDPIWVVQLYHFTAEDQQKWLEKYIRFHPETWLNKFELHHINNNSDNLTFLKELIQQPLLLYVVASLPETVSEAITRAGIYDRLFTTLIERKYSRDLQLEIFKYLSKDELRILIREIAFAIHTLGSEHITRADLLKIDESRKFLSRLPGDHFRDSIKGIMIAFYFKEVPKSKEEESLEDTSNFAIEFLHKSLREFMTAEKIVYTLKDAFLEKKKSSGRYMLDDFDQAFAVIQSLFRYPISPEISQQLQEILSGQDAEEKRELEERLMSFFPELLQASFLRGYDYRAGVSPSALSANIFCGFWHTVSCLGLSINYFTKEIRHYLVYFLGLLNFEQKAVKDLNFDNQDFSDFAMSNLTFQKCSFNNTIFQRSILSKVDFYSCIFNNTKFTGAVLDHVDYTYCENIHNCNFEGVRFEKCTFFVTEIRCCSFNGVTSGDKLLFSSYDPNVYTVVSECSFDNVSLSLQTIRWLKKHSRKCEIIPIQTVPVEKELPEEQQNNMHMQKEGETFFWNSQNYKRLYPDNYIIID
jgi:NACHT domain/Pentapeptide repeats (9 copies)